MGIPGMGTHGIAPGRAIFAAIGHGGIAPGCGIASGCAPSAAIGQYGIAAGAWPPPAGAGGFSARAVAANVPRARAARVATARGAGGMGMVLFRRRNGAVGIARARAASGVA
jgi:hypothetical protein